MKFFSVTLLVVALATIAIAEDAAKNKVEKVSDAVSKGAVDEKNAGEVAAPVKSDKKDEPVKNEDPVKKEPAQETPKDDAKMDTPADAKKEEKPADKKDGEKPEGSENNEDPEDDSPDCVIRRILGKLQDDLHKVRENIRKRFSWDRH